MLLPIDMDEAAGVLGHPASGMEAKPLGTGFRRDDERKPAKPEMTR